MSKSKFRMTKGWELGRLEGCKVERLEGLKVKKLEGWEDYVFGVWRFLTIWHLAFGFDLKFGIFLDYFQLRLNLYAKRAVKEVKTIEVKTTDQ